MRRSIGVMVASAALVLAVAGPATAHPVSPMTLQKAGWTCFVVPSLGVHCMPPSKELGSDRQVPILYFDTFDLGDWSGDLLGTELLLKNDGSRYNGQPCPQEGRDTWALVAGGTYYGCHHN